MAKKDRLIILDLDNTLLYASYAESETASLLCEYDELVCDKLNINPLEIVAGIDFFNSTENIQKRIRSSWYKKYRDIVVVDDSPELWQSADREKARFIVPPEFMGDAHDDALRLINLLD